ncbi:MAG: hypothetical protein JW715_00015 [Sedimentisphaerales bacterium]|nr:hypothetical protein [Sedimentisphaerales bacterium]
MRPADNIEKLINKLRVEPRAEASKRNLEDALAAQEKATGSAYAKPTVWRIIMKNPITKIAVAAVIVITAIMLLHNGSMEITSQAFGIDNVIEAMQKAEWIHCIMTLEQFSGDPNVTTMNIGDGWESWQSVNPMFSVEKHSDGKIYFSDRGTARTFSYDPQNNIITVKYRNPEALRNTYTSISDMYIKQLADAEKNGAKIKRKRDVYQGRQVQILDINYTSEKGLQSIFTIIIDAQTCLPKKATFLQQHLMEGYAGKMTGTFDYPDTGPKDIYEAGAPRDAKIIYSDSRDNPELIDVLKPYNAARDNLPSDYILITTYQYGPWVRSVDVIYNQGRKQRSEYHPVWGPVISEDDKIAYNKVLGNSFETLLKWSQDYGNSDGKNLGIHIYDGQYYYRAEKNPMDEWNISEKVRWPDHNPIGLKDLFDWGWPMIQPKNNVRQIENDYSKENNLVAFERILEPTVIDGKLIDAAKKEIYYLDPNHDYICVRKEDFQRRFRESIEMKDADFDINQIPNELNSVSIVSKFDQTDSGRWYPKLIETYSKSWNANGNEKTLGLSFINTLYLKTNPEFPEGIFDPNSLPKN